MNILDLSIVIVNWNTEELLIQCIDSVIKHTKSINYEIVVVDNGSEDGSVKSVKERYPEAVLVENEYNAGFTKACNQGFEESKGEYILMLNSDTIIADDALGKMVLFARQQSSAGIIGCKIKYPDGRFQSSCFRYPDILGFIFSALYLPQMFPRSSFCNRERYGMEEWYEMKEVDCVMGSCFMVKKEWMAELEYLDESYFMYCEETDFCKKMKEFGKKTLFYPDVSITHVHKGSQKNWDGIAWSHYAVNRGKLLFLYKWRSPFTAYLANLILVISVLPRFFTWLLMDIVDSIKNDKNLKIKRLKKFYTYFFNFKALFLPSLMTKPWTGPNG